jgi:hypothetical protein
VKKIILILPFFFLFVRASISQSYDLATIIVEKRSQSLELLKANLSIFSNCGTFEGENWFATKVAFPVDNWQPIYFVDDGTYYIAEIQGSKVVPLWCGTVTDNQESGKVIAFNNSFTRFEFGNRYFSQQTGEIPFYEGMMDVYSSFVNSFMLEQIDSQGIVICNFAIDLNWPGMLPLEQIPYCPSNEK